MPGEPRAALARPTTVARLVLLVVATTAVLVPAPTAITTVLVAAAAVSIIEPVVRTRAAGRLDGLLVGIFGLLATLMALGLTLHYLPGGITAHSWGVGAGLVGLGVLVGTELHDHRGGSARAAKAGAQGSSEPWGVAARSWPARVRGALLPTARRHLAPIACYVAAGVIVVLAFVLSVRATHRAERPPLTLSAAAPRTSAVAPTSDSTVLTLSSTRSGGPYRVFVNAGTGPRLVLAALTTDGVHPTPITVPTPAGQRVVVTLVDAASGHTLRTLVLGAQSPRAPR
ncbi:hypothetical protein [Frankia sp. R82]|uniref:hypothetical protein n=1 Tax=Frankia sp. R82 TaxID=2950553 RepID=UPI002044A0E5|nr:hypothetical protein [Frankia sp. R82]MCM3887281.1 hypothetical protein [Frankia sp. R82]